MGTAVLSLLHIETKPTFYFTYVYPVKLKMRL